MTLFITTKNIDYIRNTQEIRMLKDQGKQVDVLCSELKYYPLRMMELYLRLLFLSVKKYDEIFIGFEPQLILPFWWWKFRGKPVTIDFFISVYDTFVNDRKKLKAGSVLAKISHWVDTVTYHRADHIIVDTKADQEYFCEEFGRGNESVEVLYLDADTTLFYPRESVRPEKLLGRYVVLYFGSILPLQGVDVILEALNQLKGNDQFYFYMIGPMGKKVKPVISDNIEYIEWLPQAQLAEYISYADLCLAGHFSGSIDKARRTIPGKAYIYRAMDKPIILGDGSANHELFTEHDDDIFFVKMGDPTALAKKIMEIKNAKTIN